MLKQIGALVVAILIAYIPGAIGNLVNASTWYDQLDKPPLQPPGWTFGVVWTILYIATGVALYLIWRSEASNKTLAYVLFGVHMILNASWSLVSFGLEMPWAALAVIIALLIVIVLCVAHFPRISKWASWLFVPYLAWVAFATYLNAGVAILNS